MRQLIDPRMRNAIESHWPSLCDIRTLKYVTSASGQQVPDGGLSEDFILHNVPCLLGPFIENVATDTENRTVNFTGGAERRTCKLNGYFPEIQPTTMVASIDGKNYKIVGVDSDSLKFSMRLRLEIIEPRRDVIG